MKLCSKCNQEKDESLFGKDLPRCKSCENKRHREWDAKNKDKRKIIAKRSRVKNNTNKSPRKKLMIRSGRSDIQKPKMNT